MSLSKLAAAAASCILLLLPFTTTHAATSVGGTISGQTWTAAKSPYIVTGNISVASLTIQPGVSVQFAGNFVFTIAGRLTAIGEPNNRITFAAQAQGGSWKGISFEFAGDGSELAYCNISGANQGGLRIRGSRPTVRRCDISGNSVTGATAVGGGVWTDTPLTLSDCTISGNRAQGLVTAKGGGIYTTADLTLQNCVLLNNKVVAGSPGANPLGVGGAVYGEGNVTLNACIIGGNSVVSSPPSGALGVAAAGGVYAGTSLHATNAAIGYNSISGGQMAFAAGVFITEGKLVNCTVIENSATSPAGEASGGGIYAETRPDAPATVMNSILWGNTPSQLEGAFDISYSDVMGGAPGFGNISRNPLLEPGAFFLLGGSPCIDAGNPDPTYNDLCFSTGLSHGSSRNDMGAGGGARACGFLIASAPAITTQPQSRTLCPGQSASFTVAATGDAPLRYQWHFNESPIQGQTNATLILANVQASMTGSYRVTVSMRAVGAYPDEQRHRIASRGRKPWTRSLAKPPAITTISNQETPGPPEFQFSNLVTKSLGPARSKTSGKPYVPPSPPLSTSRTGWEYPPTEVIAPIGSPHTSSSVERRIWLASGSKGH